MNSPASGPLRPGARATSSFRWARTALRVYSERLPIKYLLSNHGLCLGIDTKRRSFLFIASAAGVVARTRPVGDTVVETLDYDIPRIVRALRDEEVPHAPTP